MTVTMAIKKQLAELGARKAVAELHPELHAEFRAAWAAGMSKEEASKWAYRLGQLPNADSGPYTLGLREARAKGIEDLAGMHPRQAAVLAEVPAEDRNVVASSARLLMNTSPGWNYSGALSSAAAEYRRIGAEALARKDRLTNAALMRWEVDEDGYRIDQKEAS